VEDIRAFSERGPDQDIRRELFSEQRYSEQAEGVPINDVVTNVSEMAMEFAAARRWDGEIPCLELGDGELAPISLSGFLGAPFGPFYGPGDWLEWERRGPFPPHRVWREIVRRSGSWEERVQIADVGKAEDGIQRNLHGFLSYRFAGIKKWAEWIRGAYGPSRSSEPSGSKGSPPPAVGAGGGLQVHVSCQTPGLRLHISPAYFISWVNFGSPTTPVAGYVLPGRYIFAGDGPMLPKRKRDLGVFCIPADYYPTLTRF
jgi:hypothetical protein